MRDFYLLGMLFLFLSFKFLVNQFILLLFMDSLSDNSYGYRCIISRILENQPMFLFQVLYNFDIGLGGLLQYINSVKMLFAEHHIASQMIYVNSY